MYVGVAGNYIVVVSRAPSSISVAPQHTEQNRKLRYTRAAPLGRTPECLHRVIVILQVYETVSC